MWRWGVGSDDCVVPATLLSVTHLAWLTVLLPILVTSLSYSAHSSESLTSSNSSDLESFETVSPDIEVRGQNRVFWILMFIFQGHYQLLLVLYLCVYSISLVLEVLIILVSLRGSVINSEPRRHIRPLIYVRQGLLTGELLLLVYSAKVKWRIYWIFIDQLIQWMLLNFIIWTILRTST